MSICRSTFLLRQCPLKPGLSNMMLSKILASSNLNNFNRAVTSTIQRNFTSLQPCVFTSAQINSKSSKKHINYASKGQELSQPSLLPEHYQLPPPYKRQHQYPLLSSARNFSTSPCQNDGDNDDKNNKKTQIRVAKFKFEPFKYLYKWFRVSAKMVLMRSYFDSTFTRKEFLKGAKQALIVVSNLLSKGEFEELQMFASAQAIEDCRKLYHAHGSNASKMGIEEAQIMRMQLVDIDFRYPEDGTKWAYALVECTASQRSYQDIQNQIMEELNRKHETKLRKPTTMIEHMKEDEEYFENLSKQMALRKLTCSFAREYTKGVEDSEWIVDMVLYTPWEFGSTP